MAKQQQDIRCTLSENEDVEQVLSSATLREKKWLDGNLNAKTKFYLPARNYYEQTNIYIYLYCLNTIKKPVLLESSTSKEETMEPEVQCFHDIQE